MLFELSLVPVNTGEPLSKHIAKAVRIIDEAGLNYEVTPASTCVEGTWEEVMPVLHECHRYMKGVSSHVVTTIKIEDDDISPASLTQNVIHVTEKVAGNPAERQGQVDEALKETFPASDPPSFMPGEV
ncbi:MAG: MTH1187 family thiamine-binding protein [Spirochaetota bacterium]